MLEPEIQSDRAALDWRRREAAEELYLRSRAGGLLYVLGLAFVAWFGDMFSAEPLAAAGGLALLMALALARLLWPGPPAHGDRLSRWLLAYGTVMCASGAAWGLVQLWVLLDPRFDLDTRTAVLVSTCGFATVFANVYGIVRTVAVVGIGLMFVPPVVLLWLLPDAIAMAATMSMYLGYLVAATLGADRDHQRRLDLSEALRRQRDLFEVLSRTDPLTGLANRREFTATLDRAVDARRAGDRPFALVLVDIDHFKSINDRYGHGVGDAALVALADRLQRGFAADDAVLARLGGEEFAVLLRGSGASSAVARAEQLRAMFESEPLECEGERLRVTASLGAGEFDPARHPDGDALYRDVDRALYAAKRAGRNRVGVVAASEGAA